MAALALVLVLGVRTFFFIILLILLFIIIW